MGGRRDGRRDGWMKGWVDGMGEWRDGFKGWFRSLTGLFVAASCKCVLSVYFQGHRAEPHGLVAVKYTRSSTHCDSYSVRLLEQN